MDKFEALWNYQEAEAALEKMEESLKNTEIRKRLIRQQQVFQNNRQHLEKLEQEAVITNHKILEISAQVEVIKKQVSQKDTEIAEITEHEVEDLFLEDVQEFVKECEEMKSAIESNRRKLNDIISLLEKSENDAKETIVKMSHAKKVFDQLKTAHSKELDAGRGDLERLKSDITEAATAVEPALLEQYKRIKQHRSNPVAYFKDKRCQGCNMELPSGMLQSLRDKEKVTVCENCGRILYVIDD